jgi:hypothetical protein
MMMMMMMMMTMMISTNLTCVAELKDLSWKGVPVEARPKAWQLLCVCLVLMWIHDYFVLFCVCLVSMV